MKRQLSWMILLVPVAFMCIKEVCAQQCLTYSNDLSTYTDVSTDGTYVYTTVEIDGSTDMQVAQFCAPYVPTYYHYPQVYNQLSISGGQTVGGWEYGSETCSSCYLTESNSQSIAAAPGQEVSFSWQAEGVCTGGGEFYGAIGTYPIYIAVATYYFQHSNGNGTSTYSLACPNRSVSTCGGSSYTGPQTTDWVEQVQPYILFVPGVGTCTPPVYSWGLSTNDPWPCT